MQCLPPHHRVRALPDRFTPTEIVEKSIKTPFLR